MKKMLLLFSPLLAWTLSACSAADSKGPELNGDPAVAAAATTMTGDKAGNGGGTWTCREPNREIRWTQLVDLFEAENEFHLTLAQPSGDHVAIVDQMTVRLLRVDPTLLNALVPYLNAIDYLHPHPPQVQETSDSLAVINDSLYRLQPNVSRCAGGILVPDPNGGQPMIPYEQIVNYKHDGNILLQSELFAHMNALHRAALVFHEALYAYRRQEFGDHDSTITRRIVGLLFSTRTTDELKGDLREIGANPTPSPGGLSFVRLRSGSFYYASSEHAPVPVQISHSFELQTTPVTQLQWFKVMHVPYESNIVHRNMCPNVYLETAFGGICTTFPLDNIDWDQAGAFIQQLNQTDSNYSYRLPTEAEWEYAATIGGSSYSPFDLPLTADGNIDLRSYIAGTEDPYAPLYYPVVVATKPANAWGLFDMFGNVRNLVSDWYAPEASGGVDPQGPLSGNWHVARGCAIIQRNFYSASQQANNIVCSFSNSRWTDQDRVSGNSKLLGLRLVRMPKS